MGYIGRYKKRGLGAIAFTITLFSISIVCCGVTLYVMGLLWFTNARTKQLKSLFALGLTVAAWLLFNAMSMVVQGEYFPFVYTLCIASVCCFPPACMLFCLHFAGARVVRRPAFVALVAGITLLDVAALATNPLHHLFYTAYGYPLGQFGPLFYAHAVFTYICLLTSLVLLLKKTLQDRRRLAATLTVVLMVVPMTVNVMFNLRVISLRHDPTPIGLFGAFLLFALTSYRSRMFSFRTTALTNIFDSIQDAVLITGKDDAIIDTNAAFAEAFPDFALETGKTPVRDFLAYLGSHGAAQPSLVAGMDVGGSGGEFTLAGPGGAKTYTITRRPIHNGGRLSGHAISLADVSAYRAMIEEIHQQNVQLTGLNSQLTELNGQLTELKEVAESASAAKGAFLANMSHEMRTPMNAIIGMTGIAKTADDPKRKDYCIDKIGEASVHLLGVINDVLDMSKIESGKLELSCADFDFGKMLAQVASVMSFGMQKKKLAFEVDIAGDVPEFLHTDEQRLTQVLTNLLSNAMKFTPEEGRVDLLVKLLSRQNDEATLEFTVRDNGIGISQEQQKKLFRSFQQADSSISRKYGGTGLGLAISQSIVELMGGRFRLESAPGKGSRFIFTIKAGVAKAAKPPSDTPPNDGGSPDFTGLRALLAEDIAINREIVIALLEPTGLAIDSAENGDEAVKMFEKDPTYDLVLMDIQMPEKDGYQATRELRALSIPAAKTVPIIAMTANVFKEDIDRCLAAGMDDHVGKPLDIDEVLGRLRKYLIPIQKPK